MLRNAADLGNTRHKWARLDETGRLGPSSPLPPDDPLAWETLWNDWHECEKEPSRWAVASVNPPAANHLALFLAGRGVEHITWYRTASEVPIEMDVVVPRPVVQTVAWWCLPPAGTCPAVSRGLVVSCGTAITIERINAAGSGREA